MIHVSSPISSPRFDYVLNFLSEYFGEAFVRTDATDADLAYGEVSARVIIQPAGLLSETGVRALDPSVAPHRAGFPVLFPNDSTFGFDLFAGIFYLLTRYEEYGLHPKDAYGRYVHTASLAFRHGFLREPLIHQWLEYLAQGLWGRDFRPPFRFRPTYDIDMAWSYRHKGFVRNAGGLLRSLLYRDGKAGERLRVLLRGACDPFDCYDFLDELHGRLPVAPHYFIHTGTRRTVYDKNIPLQQPAMQALVRRLYRNAAVGLH
ncbi:MAG: hypothetical protein EOO11_22005, partial [Chitinophagaceae bacterium]